MQNVYAQNPSTLSYKLIPQQPSPGATGRRRRRLTTPVSRPHATPSPPRRHPETDREVYARKRSERLSEGSP